MELNGNTYQDMYAVTGALIHSTIEPQSDNNTYAIFNFTSEYMQNIKAGAILVEGYNNDAIVLMNDVEIKDCTGDTNSSVIDL